MKVIYKSSVYKFLAVMRYFIVKSFFFRRATIKRISMIGRRCGIYLVGEGTLFCEGRIIIADDSMLYTKGSLRIGKNFGLNSFSRIVVHDTVKIGNNVTIGQMVSILDHDHHFAIDGNELSLRGYRTSPVNIGNNVWVGDKSTILRGVTIGNNVVVGANTLVNNDVPDNCVVGGVPFQILRRL